MTNDHISRLRVCVELAARALRRYEMLHRAKGTPESTGEAEINASLASRFERTLAEIDLDTQGAVPAALVERGRKEVAAGDAGMPEIVQRVLRFAGKERREVSNPNITAREAIKIADWMRDAQARIKALEARQW